MEDAPGVAVRDDGAKVVNPGRCYLVPRPPLIPHLTIMQLLGLPQPLHLVRDRRVRVISQIRPNLVVPGR